MVACNKPKATHEEFMRLVYAVESNKMNLQSSKKSSVFSTDDEMGLKALIKSQERLLKEMMETLKSENEPPPDHDS